MAKKSRKKVAAAATGSKAKPQAQAQQQALNGVVSPKMRKVSKRLKDLEDEKARIEQMIQQLASKNKKDESFKPKGKTAAVKTKKSRAAVPQKEEEEESFSDRYSDESSVFSTAHNGNHKHNNNKRNYYTSEESCLYTGRRPKPHKGTSERQFDADDLSVMTEDFYHYDMRGKRITDEDLILEDTETLAAVYQQMTGRSDGDNSDQSTTAGHGTKKKTKQKKNKRRDEDAPRVTIEWQRGRTYKPEANLAFDSGELFNLHPSDLSLLVAGDNQSYWDEDLSFSSGEDSKLAAAATDMPVQIQLLQDGDDAISVSSGLHSECSVSVAAAPMVTKQNRQSSQYIGNHNTSNGKQHHSSQAHSGLGMLHNSRLHNSHSNPNQFLYQRINSLDDSHDSHDLHNNNNNNDCSQQEPSRRRRRPGREEQPPPLTSDMSLVDERENLHHDRQHERNNGDNPPAEISFSELSLNNSMDSLGSEMGGVSLAPGGGQDAHQPTKSSNSHNAKHSAKAATPTTASLKKTTSNNSKKKNKQAKAKAAPPPQTPRESPGPTEGGMLLGDPDSESEENELSAGDLGFSVKDKEEFAKNMQQQKLQQSNDATTSPKQPKKPTVAPPSAAVGKPAAKLTRRVTTGGAVTSSKKKLPQQHAAGESNGNNLHRSGSASSLTGLDAATGAQSPKRVSTPPRKPPKTTNGRSTPPPPNSNSKIPTTRTRKVPNGVKNSKGENVKRQNSNSTCNSSITSPVPGGLDNNNNARALVIE